MYLYRERMYMCICIYECMNMYLWKTRSFSYLIFDSSLFENTIMTWDHGSLVNLCSPSPYLICAITMKTELPGKNVSLFLFVKAGVVSH